MIHVAEGPLNYSFNDFQIWPTTFTYTAATIPVAVRARNAGEMTIGAQNMYRLFDDNPSNGPDDGINCRLNRASRYWMQCARGWKLPDRSASAIEARAVRAP